MNEASLSRSGDFQSPIADPSPACPPWFAPDAWKTQRADSLLVRLWHTKTDGGNLLEETLYLLSLTTRDAKGKPRWEMTTNEVARGLKTQGVTTSTAAVHELRSYHVAPWKVWKAEGIARLRGLSDDHSAAALQAIRRSTFVLAMESGDIESVEKLSNIVHSRAVEQDQSTRTDQLERRVRVAENTLELKRYQEQERGAEEIEAIFADAGRLLALQKAREEMESSGLDRAQRIEAIRLRLYGEQAAVKPQPEAQIAPAA